MVEERQELARMYMSRLRDGQGSPWPREKVEAHLACMDFTKEVSLRTLNEGDPVERFGKQGEPTGDYFAPLGSEKMKLGICGEAAVEDRQREFFRVTKDVEMLVFTAKDTDSFQRYPLSRQWAETDQTGPPPPYPSGELFYGGGQAYLVSDKTAFDPVFSPKPEPGAPAAAVAEERAGASLPGADLASEAARVGGEIGTVEEFLKQRALHSMSYEERRKVEGLVEHFGSEKVEEDQMLFEQQGEKIHKILQDLGTAGDVQDGLKALKDAQEVAKTGGTVAPEQTQETAPTYRIYRSLED